MRPAPCRSEVSIGDPGHPSGAEPPDAAPTVERILDAAALVFGADGVETSEMAAVAAAAGCTKATLYQHFASRLGLQAAVVRREADRLAGHIFDEVGRIENPGERLLRLVLTAVEVVRSSPTLAAWFDRGDGRVASQLIQDSAQIEALSAAGFGDASDPDALLRARWTIRVIVSFLTFPGAEEEERALLERFLVPVVVDGHRPPPRPEPARSAPAAERIDIGRDEAGRSPVDHILDAALIVFEADGFSEGDLEQVALTAGCPLEAVLEHFPSEHELRVGLVEREGTRVAARLDRAVAAIEDPAERLVRASLLALEEIRSTPVLAAWFEQGDARVASLLLLESDVMLERSASFIGDPDDPDTRRLARWFHRVVVSLVTFPAADEAEERLLLHRFLGPVVALFPS